MSRVLGARLAPVVAPLRDAIATREGSGRDLVAQAKECIGRWVADLAETGQVYASDEDRAALVLALRSLHDERAVVPCATGPVRDLRPRAISTPRAKPIAASIAHSLDLGEKVRSSKTQSEYRAAYRKFAAWMATQHIDALADVDGELMARYKAHLLTKEPLHTGRQRATGALGLSAKTFNKRWVSLNLLFKDAQAAGDFPRSAPLPTAGLIMSKKSVARTVRSWLPLTQPDIAKVFNQTFFSQWRKPHELWVPVLMLHHGLRVGEAAQLRVRDVARVGDWWTLSVNDEGDDVRLKTESSRRVIPVHPDVVRLGLLEYVEDVRRVVGDDFLFPYLLADSSNGRGRIPGRGFNAYVAKTLHDKRKRSHSCRHTVNEMLKAARVGEEVRCQLLGHEHDSINSSVYGQPLSVASLAEAVFPHLAFASIDYDAWRYIRGSCDDVLRTELRRRQRQLSRRG